MKDGEAFVSKYIRDAPTEKLRKGSIGETAADDIAAAKGYRVFGPDDGFNKKATNASASTTSPRLRTASSLSSNPNSPVTSESIST